MYTTVCVAREVNEGFKLKFFFGKNVVEALRNALMARSTNFNRDLCTEVNTATIEWFSAHLSASMGHEERWIAASNAKEAVEKLLLPQPSILIH